MHIQEISLDEIKVVSNVRNIDDNPDIIALAESMRENGQEVEIRVYQVLDAYHLKAGHRRLAAARINGWETIRAVVEDPPETVIEMIISQYNENEERRQMTYLEKASVYRRLRDLGMTQHEIAVKFSKHDADVSLAIAALNADPKLQEALVRWDEGKKHGLSPSAIEPLLSMPLDEQAELADAAINARTARKVKSLVSAHKRKQEEYNKDMTNEQEELPEDIDPMEVMSMNELTVALHHMKVAELSQIKHPELIRKARPTVEQLVRSAATIKEYLDGDTYDGTTDLV